MHSVSPPSEAHTVSTPDTKSDSFAYIGRSAPRIDGFAKVLGSTRFTGDLMPHGLLFARLVTSIYPHARIVQVDRSEAESLPGVVAVLLGDDLPLKHAGGSRRRDPLARDRVLYHGHPVAVVVAASDAIADDAAERVKIEYEPLAPVVDPLGAMNETASPVLPKGLVAEDEEAAMHGAESDGQDNDESPNITSRVCFTRGDVDAGFAEADVVVEREFRTPWVHQGYLEPQVAVARWDDPGHVTVWASTQTLFFTQSEVAEALGLHARAVTVKAMPVGGGFGGKFGLIEPLAAAVARVVGRPVRLEYRRSDEFVSANPAAASIIKLRVGARADGCLSALSAHLVFDTGSSPSSAAKIAPTLIGGHYRVPNLLVEGFEVLTHKTGGGSYRAPGAVQAHFAVESVMDELSFKLGRDPLDLRMQNAAKEGDLRPSGATWPRLGFEECLAQVKTHHLWRDRGEMGGGKQDPDGRRVGIGLAAGGWPGGIEPATAACRVDDDGTVTIVVGAVDISGTHTGFRLIAAEALGIHPDLVRVVIEDSDSAPRSGGSGGSKITYTVGTAVHQAAMDARTQLLAAAADHLEVSIEDLTIVDSQIRVKGVPGRSLDFTEAVRHAQSTASVGPVYGRGSSSIDRLAPGFGVHIARVAVDPGTGVVEVTDYAVVQDVGRVINRAEVEGQVHGGVTQGIGWALFEAITHTDEGQVMTGTLMDYPLPRSSQLPRFDVSIVEVPSEAGPYGAKGVGEPPVIPVAAAIANAIHDACGVRLTTLPLTPERILRAIETAASGEYVESCAL